ncbi:hypothetical protein [Acetobacterium wieringae]|uniref:hypothetical protein n=1 Tax=Acetobacterium wieringae TaxID=52694 RepID=UPI002B21A83C|nr:hypothetical protein [Acetobacterium wieringae]MEA4804647.1 hypothetical protein [Acetobacterium wieringae]
MLEKRVVNDAINKMQDKKYLNYIYQINDNEPDNVLKAWLEYKYPSLASEKNKTEIDLDVSLFAIVTYCIELEKLKDSNAGMLVRIEEQMDNKSNYSIKLNDSLEIRGDWLTSPLHIIKLYMGFLWEEHMKYDSCSPYARLYKRTTRKHLLFAPEGKWEEYCYENADIIWDSFDEEAKIFLVNTISAGNFINMPIYINPCRCKAFGGDDTIDTLLWKMYCSFTLCTEGNSNALDNYLKKAFSGKNQELARENVKNWIKLYDNSWDKFIEYNYLSSMVFKTNNKCGRPFDLRKEKQPISLRIGEEYNPLPKSIEECRSMFKNYNSVVDIRTIEIFEKVIKS